MLTARQKYMRKYNTKYALKNKKIIQENARLRRIKNREKYRAYDKNYYWSNPEFNRRRWRKYSRTHRAQINKMRRNRYAKNIDYKLKCIMRARFLSAIKNKQKKGSILKLLGCTIQEFKTHIEKIQLWWIIIRIHPYVPHRLCCITVGVSHF